jgi:hypothetical protein
MSLFKYFSEERFARAFIDKGALLMRPLSYFRAVEDGLVRGDPRDGILSYAPAAGLSINKEDGTTLILEGGRFTSSARHDEVFVYCASTCLSAELARRFESPFCVEIRDEERLVARLRPRAHASSTLAYDALVAGGVDYRDPERAPGIDWALPDRLAFIKSRSFAWQEEFRIVVGRRGAMDVHNVVCTVETGPSATVGAEGLRASPLLQKVGSLSEVAELHRL